MLFSTLIIAWIGLLFLLHVRIPEAMCHRATSFKFGLTFLKRKLCHHSVQKKKKCFYIPINFRMKTTFFKVLFRAHQDLAPAAFFSSRLPLLSQLVMLYASWPSRFFPCRCLHLHSFLPPFFFCLFSGLTLATSDGLSFLTI